MSRARQWLLVLLVLVAVAAVAYWAERRRPEPERITGLAWLPAESGLVGGADLAAVRQQAWLVEMLRGVSGEEAPEYRAFVEATGFDYTRDLDRLWVGVYGASEQPTVVGVAEGRFARGKILSHARRQGGRVSLYGGLEIYEVRSGPQRQNSFAFAFLDDTRVAFGSDARRAAQVVDCWQGRAPSVGSDAARRAALEQFAAGQDVWAVDELDKWQSPTRLLQDWVQTPLAQVAAGARVIPEGLAADAEARCRDPQQAGRLYVNLRSAALAGRLTLARHSDKNLRAVGEALGNVDFSQEGDALRARVLLPPELVATLLGVRHPAPSPPRAQP